MSSRIGTDPVDSADLMALHAANPSMLGISTSSTIRSGDSSDLIEVSRQSPPDEELDRVIGLLRQLAS